MSIPEFPAILKANLDYSNGVLTGVKYDNANLTLSDSSGTAYTQGDVAGLSFSLTGINAVVNSSATETVTPDGHYGGSINMSNTTLTLDSGQLTIQGLGALSSIVYSDNLATSPATFTIGQLGINSTLTVDSSYNATLDFSISGNVVTFLDQVLSPSDIASVNEYLGRGSTFGIDMQGTTNVANLVNPPTPMLGISTTPVSTAKSQGLIHMFRGRLWFRWA